MIVLTRLNESQFAVNPDLIERILTNPDTTLVMVDGAKYIVTESMHDVIEMITAYRARIIRVARGVPPVEHAGTPPLGLVPALVEDADDAEDVAGPVAGPLSTRPRTI